MYSTCVCSKGKVCIAITCELNGIHESKLMHGYWMGTRYSIHIHWLSRLLLFNLVLLYVYLSSVTCPI